MKESVLDVLMYLYENYHDADYADDTRHPLLLEELVGAGFPEQEVKHAIDWLSGLAEGRRTPPEPGTVPGTIRVYAALEQARLPVECRGFLHYLEQVGILNAVSRELAVDRLMALDEEIDIERVKWVLLLVLLNQPGHEDAHARIEDLVYQDGEGLH